MRVLVLSDIHGNFHALEAVLRAADEAGRVDELWNLGDAVGYGAHPNEVLNCLRERATLNVRGNHDRVCAGLTSSAGFNPVAAAAAEWTQRTLTDENLEWLASWPQGPLQATDRAVCVHGSPLHEDAYITSMRDAFAPLQQMPGELAFFGHTHVQGSFSQQGTEWREERTGNVDRDRREVTLAVPLGSRHLINPGSVGQPRDSDSRAAFLLYDTSADTVTFHRARYDVQSAAADIRRAGLPERLATRLELGK